MFVAFATLFNTCFDKIDVITIDSPKFHNTVKSVHFVQILMANFAYSAGIMLNAFALLLCLKLCWHNRLKLAYALCTVAIHSDSGCTCNNSFF